MARLAVYSLVCLLALPSTVHAIQLHWADGSTNITFSQNTRAVLIVQADSAEVTLPGQWTLEWLADSLGANIVAVDSAAACLADTAKVRSIDPPATLADSAAHQITAHFCSGGSDAATTAYFVLDQSGGSQGKLRVVALDPTDPDSNRVIASGEVTYNGGVDGAYAPTILRLTANHQTLQLRVTVVGFSLAGAQTATVIAPDSSWSIPLTIVDRSPTTVTAEAAVPVCLSTASLALADSAGNSTTGLLVDTPNYPEVNNINFASWIDSSEVGGLRDGTPDSWCRTSVTALLA